MENEITVTREWLKRLLELSKSEPISHYFRGYLDSIDTLLTPQGGNEDGI